jgi:hypothetical protein
MQCKRPCPLYPPIATAKADFPQTVMFALHPKADIVATSTLDTHCECHTAEAFAKSFGQRVTSSFLRHWTMIGIESVLRPV